MQETITSPIIVLTALIMVIYLLVKRFKKKSESKYLYRAKRQIMTANEAWLFGILRDSFEKEYFILPQVHLSTLFNHKIKGQDWHSAFWHINGKSVDFVLCDKRDLKPVCAIELDDKTHDSDERVKRDVEVARIFESAGLPLLRLRRQHYLGKEKELREALSDMIRSS